MAIRPLEWRDDHLAMLDQRSLPHRVEWIRLETWQSVELAIRDMVVRGAPAIGVAAGYGMALAAMRGDDLNAAAEGLASSRPTAVNLFWAIDRMRSLASADSNTILSEAMEIEREDETMNEAIGQAGATIVPSQARILTICNTGSLATIGIGTALGVIRTAFDQGKVTEIYACETRPRLQGLKLTAWELSQSQIPYRMIPDSAAASLMHAGRVDFVIAGADRIAANGDTANKIGTYSLACLAEKHGIPFAIAAPSSTIDANMATGDLIPIEERAAEEITEIDGVPVAPNGTPVWNPGFDVTPGNMIYAIITELGVFRSPYNFGDHK